MKEGTGAEGRPLLRPLSSPPPPPPLTESPASAPPSGRPARRPASRGARWRRRGGRRFAENGGGRGSVRRCMWPRGRAVRGAAARRAGRRGDAWGASTPMRRKTSRARQKNHARAGRVHRRLSPRETAGRGGARECGATHHGGGGAREVAWDERERGANGRSEGAGRKNNTPPVGVDLPHSSSPPSHASASAGSAPPVHLLPPAMRPTSRPPSRRLLAPPPRATAAAPSPPAPLVVAGSINADLVLRVDRLPVAGETVGARSLHTFPGGKVREGGGTDDAPPALLVPAFCWRAPGVIGDTERERRKETY